MMIPADGFVIEAHEVTIDESSLTGETQPLKKMSVANCSQLKSQLQEEGVANVTQPHELPSPLLLAGTKVLTGEGLFCILLVGDASSEGRIKVLLQAEVEATPLQQKLEAIAEDIGKLGLYSAVLIVVILLIRFAIERILNNSFDSENAKEILSFFIIAVTVIVVAVPEGLPLAVTIALAYSVGKMKDENNLVRYLAACETMGGANNICSDKTGTLT